MQPESKRLQIPTPGERSIFSLHEYDYYLPATLIAQHPKKNRDASRLLALNRKNGAIRIGQFADLLEILPPQALIVVNNSRVIPGRLRNADGDAKEMLILTPLTLLQRDQTTHNHKSRVEAEVLLRPARKGVPGKEIRFGKLQARVLHKEDFGKTRVELMWDARDSLEEILMHSGEIPLPPYIRRPADHRDRERYQTSYASADETGSIAAPTAGLHLTPEFRQRLLQAGHEWAEVTLFVGYGTFSPIREQDIRKHQMHAEYVKISKDTADAIQLAQQSGRAIVAVGTTSMRTIEGVAAKLGAVEPFEGWLDTYIYPGFDFQVVKGLITNFHLPRSSLLVLVSAFAGRDQILTAYRKAVAERFQFFSYGDAMFIHP